MAYEMDTTFSIYSEDGFFYEVASDSDGLGNVELKYYEKPAKYGQFQEPDDKIILTEESLPFIIEALTRHMEALKSKSDVR